MFTLSCHCLAIRVTSSVPPPNPPSPSFSVRAIELPPLLQLPFWHHRHVATQIKLHSYYSQFLSPYELSSFVSIVLSVFIYIHFLWSLLCLPCMHEIINAQATYFPVHVTATTRSYKAKINEASLAHSCLHFRGGVIYT